MSRVLVIRFSSLGDVVLLSALIEALARQNHDAETWLVTKQRYAELYRHDPRVARIVCLGDERGALGEVVRQLDGVRFDRIYDAHASLRSRLLTLRLPPAPVRRVAKDSVARSLFVRRRLRFASLGRDAVDRYLELVDPPSLPWRPHLVVPETSARRAAEIVPGTPLLCFAPGARHETKRWDEDRYVELGRRFVAEENVSVAVVGSPPEAPLCNRIAQAIPGAVAVADDALDLPTIAAVLARASLLVCNDSGLMHVTESVGTPVLALFGPTSRELGFFPQDPHSRVVEHALECRPCSRTGARACHMPEQWCMTRSTVNLVYSNLQNQWRTLRIRSHLASTSQAT